MPVTRSRLDAEAVQALATMAGLELARERAKRLSGDAERLLRLYHRVLRTAPDDVPPAAVFRVERRRHDR